MKPLRRTFLHLATSAATLPVIPRIAQGQAYPSRPVRIMVGFPAGGTTDIVGRLVGQWLSEHLGQQFVVENRPGASANIATEAVNRAAPDGYTLLMLGAVNTINATLFDKLNFDFVRDIAPIGSIIDTPLVVEVNPSVPARTIPEFIAYAKGNAGKINLATPGTGTPPHVAGELFKMMTGVDMVHVPYRGTAPMLTDLIGGQVQVAFDPLPASIQYIKAGKLRALAVTTVARSEALPDIPSVVPSRWHHRAKTGYPKASRCQLDAVRCVQPYPARRARRSLCQLPSRGHTQPHPPPVSVPRARRSRRTSAREHIWPPAHQFRVNWP